MGGVIFFLATDTPAPAVYIDAAATPAANDSQNPFLSPAPDTVTTPLPSEIVTPKFTTQANAQMPGDTVTPNPTTKPAATPKPTPKPTAAANPTPTVTATPIPPYNPPASPNVSPTPKPSIGDGGDIIVPSIPPEYSSTYK